MENKEAVLITSTYNGSKFLRQLLDSVLQQSYEYITLFVRDDGSKDNSVAILKEYQKKFAEARGQKQIVILNEQDNDWSNHGSHQSYHKLMANIPEAPYYLFCDQDDVWEYDKVERAIQAMSRYPEEVPVLWHHNYFICDHELNKEGVLSDNRKVDVTPEEMKQIDLGHVIMTGTWAGVGMAQAFNHRLMEIAFRSGKYEETIAIDCWMSWVVCGADGALLYDEKPLALYRRHAGTFSSGDKNGLVRYRDWYVHMDRHCNNIINGIHWFRILYGDRVADHKKAFLDRFDGYDKKYSFFRAVSKAVYPKRLRDSLGEEIAFRVLMLVGKI